MKLSRVGSEAVQRERVVVSGDVAFLSSAPARCDRLSPAPPQLDASETVVPCSRPGPQSLIQTL